MIPIFGGSYDTEALLDLSRNALDTGGPIAGIARESVEITGEQPTPARTSISAGPRTTDRALMSLSTGPLIQDAARHAADIYGVIVRAAVASLTVLPPPQLWPVRTGITVVTSATSRASARCGLAVRGRRSLPARHAFDVRGEPSFAARAALSVREAGAFWPVRSALTVGSLSEGVSRNALDVREMDGFFILADVTSSALTNPASLGHYYPYQDITALLAVDGRELPFSAFDYEEAADKLGATLNVQLADEGDFGPHTAVWNGTDFSLVLTDSEGADHVVGLVSGGRIGGREFVAQFSRDTLSIGAIDLLADKFSLCPRVPVVMFDPRYVEYSSVEVRPRDAIQTESGGVILPLLEPVEGLTWLQAAKRAYTNLGGFSVALRPSIVARMRGVMRLIDGGLSATTLGLGFAGIVTNIPDYPVTRVDFSVEGGWHDGVQPLIGMYNPLYFPGDSSRLFIMDARRPLPYGYVAHAVTESSYAVLAQSIPFRDLFNAVLLTFQYHDNDLGLSVAEEWLEDEVQKQGTFGLPDYAELVVKQRVLRVRDADGNIVNEAPTLRIQETYRPTLEIQYNGETGQILGWQTGGVILFHRDTQQDFYQDFYKVGHHKTVESIFRAAATSLDLVTALTEDCTIVWKDDPQKPGTKIQASSHTYVEGIAYVEIGPDGTPQAAPALLADASHLLDLDVGQLMSMPLRTVTETLRVVKGVQLDCIVVECDLLNNTVHRSVTQPRISSGLVSFNKFENRQVTVLLRNTTSEDEIGPRRPQPVNAGELPRNLALELGKRVLADGFDPPQHYRVSLPGVDLSLRRGSVIRARNPSGSYTPELMVVGLTISGRNLGTTGHRISMTLDCVELKTAARARSEGWALALR